MMDSGDLLIAFMIIIIALVALIKKLGLPASQVLSKKLTMKYIAYFSALIYLLCSLHQWNLNPGKWVQDARLTCALCIFIVNLIGVMIMILSNIKLPTENKEKD